MRRIVIVGASVAGVHAAEALRDQGFDGEIRLVGAEDPLPYDRPPLSKLALTGPVPGPELLLRPASWYAERDIVLCLGQPATSLTPRARTVELADGTVLTYDGVVLATGVLARTVSDVAAAGRVQTLRTALDSARLRERLVPGSRLIVIGGGFIGLEVAASARTIGVGVTVVEIGPAPLAAVLGVEVGDWFRRLHERNGVSIRCGESVRAISDVGECSRVQLSGGDVLLADTVLAGVGTVPATGWLRSSGLNLVRGAVACDARLRTAAPGVVAAGDVAYWPNELVGESMRVEHWTNAVEQGRYAALSLLDATDGPFAGVPYFWTDQFNASTRTIGCIAGAERVIVRHGDDDSLVAIYGRGDVFRGAVCVNAPRALLASRRTLMSGAQWADALPIVGAT